MTTSGSDFAENDNDAADDTDYAFPSLNSPIKNVKNKRPQSNGPNSAQVGGAEKSGKLASRQQIVPCTICGDSSDGLHFGASACRACAAFFRRTVARRLKYVCRFANDCEIDKNSRAICRSCRLAKCKRMGMNPRAVTSEYHYNCRRAGRQGPSVPSRSASPASPLPLPRPVPIAIGASSSARLESPTNSCQPVEPGLRQIIERFSNATDSSADFLVLPAGQCQPILTKMLAGYERLQKRRDEGFGRVREYNGVPSRIYLEKKEIEFRSFSERIRLELDWLAELLTAFEGYPQLDIQDKMVFFKRFWSIYLVLERCMDTLRVLGPSPDDPRVVFSNGDIVNLNTANFDMRSVLEHPEHGNYRPWFRHAHEMLPPLKKLGPDESEMAFCLEIAFWKIPPDMSSKVSEEAVAIAERAAKGLYGESAQHYAEMKPVPNAVERVVEIMRLISYAEKVVQARKEDAILAKTFKAFKIDVFMENVFGPVETD